jgi:UDP-glucose 4-epimerase
MVVAARIGLSEPINVAGPGAITAWQAIRRGRRLPVPNVGPEWAITRRVSSLLGAPVPDHVVETLHRGRLIDAGRAGDVLGLRSLSTTPEVIDSLYEWESVVRLSRADLFEAEVGVA